jgi:hypothetical protein
MNGRSGKIGQTNGHTCNFIMSRILSNIEIHKKVKGMPRRYNKTMFKRKSIGVTCFENVNKNS